MIFFTAFESNPQTQRCSMLKAHARGSGLHECIALRVTQNVHYLGGLLLLWEELVAFMFETRIQLQRCWDMLVLDMLQEATSFMQCSLLVRTPPRNPESPQMPHLSQMGSLFARKIYRYQHGLITFSLALHVLRRKYSYAVHPPRRCCSGGFVLPFAGQSPCQPPPPLLEEGRQGIWWLPKEEPFKGVGHGVYVPVNQGLGQKAEYRKAWKLK